VPNAREQIGGIGAGAVVNHGNWFFFVSAYRFLAGCKWLL
jgi:hypothetical protein